MNRYELKKTILKVLIIIPVIIIRFFPQFFLTGTTKRSVSDYFMVTIFGIPPERTQTQSISIIASMLEIIIFVIIFGTYLYSFFQNYNIYIIIRERSIKNWYRRIAARLFVCCMAYIGIFFASIYILGIIKSESSMTMRDVYIPLTAYILTTFFTYVITMTMNILALKYKQVKSFAIIIFAILFMIWMAIDFEKIIAISRLKILLWLNPVNNMQISWDLEPLNCVKSVIYYIVLSIAVTVIGRIMYIKSDMGMTGEEE